MDDSVLLGLRRCMLPIPRSVWQKQAHGNAQLGFMSDEHHRIRNFVVKELPRAGKPLSPHFIAQELRLPVTRTTDILDELEQRMTFLFRNEQGAVAWAYPVTVEHTPHHVTFSTGEQIYAA
jgi:hypothetical protein